MHPPVSAFALRICLVILLMPLAGTQEQDSPLNCRIEIVHPQNGDSVPAGTGIALELGLVDCPVPVYPFISVREFFYAHSMRLSTGYGDVQFVHDQMLSPDRTHISHT